MANINDYLRWRGDIRIDTQHPFNDVDAMIMARASYLPYDKIKMRRHETFRSIADKMHAFREKQFNWPGDREMIQLLGKSPRFSNMRVTDYVKANDRTTQKQFSAVTIHLSKTEMYLSFFGTDSSITGWKEDFNMAIMDVIPAQEEGARYLRRMVMKYPLKQMRLGGHSKGGNISMYTAVTAPDVLQRRIIRVYNFDGPGLKKETADLDTGIRVVSRIHSFVPQDSLVGRLFEHSENFTVIKSVEKNLYQHDIFSWQVERDKIVESTATKASVFMDKTISKWLASASLEDREIFVNGMFEIFDSADVATPFDIMNGWYKHMPTMIKAYRGKSKEEREVIMAVWKKLADSFLKVRAENKEKKAGAKQAVKAEKKETKKVRRAGRQVRKVRRKTTDK